MRSKSKLFWIKEKIALKQSLKGFFTFINAPVYRIQQARFFKKTYKRLNNLIFVMCLILSIFVVRLSYLYFFHGNNSTGRTLVELTGANNSTIVSLIENLPSTKRADILDVNGTIIATSIPNYSVFLKASETHNLKMTLALLKKLFPSMNMPILYHRLKQHKDFIWIAHDLNDSQSNKLKSYHIPGIYIIPTQKRIYPQGSLLSEVVGMVGTDQKGLNGVEYALNRRIMKSKRPLQLTIDTRIQYIVRDSLYTSMKKWKAEGAVGIVMNIQTGDVIAMVSLPDFNPNDPRHTTNNQRFNRATLGVYELGSVFKIINTAFALESGKIFMDSMFSVTPNLHIGPYIIHDEHDRNFHTLNVAKIFVYSSNIGSAKMAMQLGVAAQKKFMSKLPFHPTPSFPIAGQGRALFPHPWNIPELVTISYGHGLAVTPLQFITASSSLIGPGRVLTPNLVVGKNKTPGRRLISLSTTKQLRELLRVNVLHGTGRNAQVRGYMVGGKTGTANTLNRRTKRYSNTEKIVDFIGFFPMDNPQYAIYIMIDNPKATTRMASKIVAPSIAKIIRRIAPILGFQPKINTLKKQIFQKKIKKFEINYIEKN